MAKQLSDSEVSESESESDDRGRGRSRSPKRSMSRSTSRSSSRKPRLACVNCDSEDVRRVAMVFDEGTIHNTGQSTTTGVGIPTGTRGGARAATTSSASTTQSNLAKKCKPPEYAPVASLIFTGLFVGVVTVTINWAAARMVLAIFSFLCFVGAYNGWKENKSVPGKIALWEKSFLCCRCGEMFAWPPTVITVGEA